MLHIHEFVTCLDLFVELGSSHRPAGHCEYTNVRGAVLLGVNGPLTVSEIT